MQLSYQMVYLNYNFIIYCSGVFRRFNTSQGKIQPSNYMYSTNTCYISIIFRIAAYSFTYSQHDDY